MKLKRSIKAKLDERLKVFTKVREYRWKKTSLKGMLKGNKKRSKQKDRKIYSKS